MEATENTVARPTVGRLTRRQLLRTVAVGFGLPALAGMVGCSAAPPAATTPPPAAAPKQESTQAPAVSKAQPSPTASGPKGEIKYALGAEPFSADPHSTTGGAAKALTCNLFESLYEQDLTGMNLVPKLATSYKVSSDGLAYEFTLRKGVKFHNGDVMTAEDVKFSVDRVFDPEVKAYALQYFKSTDRVEVLGEDRIVVHLKEPDATLRNIWSGEWGVVSKKYLQTVGNDAFREKPIGTGPWKMVDRRLNEYIVLEAFEGHWETVPSVKTVRMIIVPDDEARVAMLKTGEADIVHQIPPFAAPELDAIPGLRTKRVGSREVLNFTINARDEVDPVTGGKNPYVDVRVRQAINHAVDKDTIIKRIMMGQAIATATLVTSTVLGYDPSLKPYSYDPKKAKDLLAAAGYPQGFPSKLCYPTGARYPMAKEISEAVAGYLTEVGVKTEVIPLEYEAWIKITRARTEIPLLLHGAPADGVTGDPQSKLLNLTPTSQQRSWYATKELDALVNAAGREYDVAKREKTLQQIFKLMYDEAAMLFLFETVQIWGLRERVEWEPQPAPAAQKFYNVRITK